MSTIDPVTTYAHGPQPKPTADALDRARAAGEKVRVRFVVLAELNPDEVAEVKAWDLDEVFGTPARVSGTVQLIHPGGATSTIRQEGTVQSQHRQLNGRFGEKNLES